VGGRFAGSLSSLLSRKVVLFASPPRPLPPLFPSVRPSRCKLAALRRQKEAPLVAAVLPVNFDRVVSREPRRPPRSTRQFYYRKTIPARMMNHTDAAAIRISISFTVQRAPALYYVSGAALLRWDANATIADRDLILAIN